MRVLHVYHDFWPTRGGIEDYLAYLSLAQVTQGLEPTVLCANHRPITRHQQFYANLPNDTGSVAVIWAAAWGRYFMPFCPSWPLWVRRLQPDLVHLHLPCPLGEWAVWLARPARLVVSLHNDYVRPKLAVKLHRPLHRAVLGQANAIIVGTPDYARTSPVLHNLQHKVRLVPYGLYLKEYAPEKETSTLGPHFEVLFAGRLCYYKGVQVLLEAAPAIKGRIGIIGDGPWRKRLQAQAQQNRLGKQVCFMGTLPESALLEQMRTSQVFVFPSTERSEAFGLAQLKAMACGLPVVSSDLPGVSWLNRHGETGLVTPARDAAALAQAVNQLLVNAPMRQQLAANARKHACQFSVARMAQETKDVYELAS